MDNSSSLVAVTDADQQEQQKEEETSIFCPVCKGKVDTHKIIYDYSLGEQICSLCGAVIGEQRKNDFFTIDSVIDTYHIPSDVTYIEERGEYMLGHESKYYGTKGSGLSGIGGNIITRYTETMDFSSSGVMSSQIDQKNFDFNGAKIKDVKAWNRWRRMNSITPYSNKRNPNEKNIKEVVIFVKQISQKKNFPPYIQENTVNLYRRVSKNNDIKRLQYRITAYWCLFYVLRKNNLTTSLPEFLTSLVDLGFIDDSNGKEKAMIQRKMNKTQVFILDLLDLEPIQHSNYMDNISFLCNKHGLSEMIKRQCLKIGTIINNKCGVTIHQGRSPKTIATMIIAMIMVKEGMHKECKELLKDLKITPIILNKILVDIIDITKQKYTDNKEINENDEDIQELTNLLSYFNN